MEGYLGEEIVDIEQTEYKNYTQNDWIKHWLYLNFDGESHKDWLLDQIARIINGTPVIISIARWKNGYYEYRFKLGEPTESYHNWVAEYEKTHEYNLGTPP